MSRARVNSNLKRLGPGLLSQTNLYFLAPFTVVTLAMAMKPVGIGSQYGILALDANGDYLDSSCPHCGIRIGHDKRLAGIVSHSDIHQAIFMREQAGY